MGQRNNFWQAVRGICIICVVLIHCRSGISFKEDSIFLSWNYDYWLALRQFINFPVAIFIFLAGYFTNQEKVKKNVMEYFTGRVRRILVPYLIWTAFYTVINTVLGYDLGYKTLVKNLFLGGASTPLYYLVVLMQLVILTPILLECLKSKWLNRLCFLITPMYLLVMYYYQFSNHRQMPFYSIFCFAWFIFYYFGLYVNYMKLYKSSNDKLKTNAVFLVLVALCLSIVECYVLLYFGASDGFASSQIKISSYMYVITVINLLFLLEKKYIQENSTLIKLGNASFGVYFAHCFVLIFVNKLMGYIPIIHNILPLYQLIQLTITIGVSYGIVVITKRVVGEKFSNLIGF